MRNRDKKKIKKLLSEIGFLSAREQSGCGIIKEITGRNAIQLIDPVFLLEKKEWEKLAGKKKKRKALYSDLYDAKRGSSIPVCEKA